MCLAVPAKLIECSAEHVAVADLHGNRVEVSTILVPEAQADDWVLIHAGFAIQRLDEDEARATFALLADLSEAAAQEGAPHDDA